MSSFFDAFNASLSEAEKIMGENWSYQGAVWPAIEIEDLATSLRPQRGGHFREATLVLTIRLAVAQRSGIAEQRVIEARGQALRVLSMCTEGDDSLMLVCGPVGVRT